MRYASIRHLHAKRTVDSREQDELSGLRGAGADFLEHRV